MTEVVRGSVTDVDPTVEAAHVKEQEIKADVQRIRRNWLDLARHLHEFHEGKMWKPLGYPHVLAWLCEPEVDLEYRQFYALIQVYRELVVNQGADVAVVGALPVTKLQAVTSAVHHGMVDLDEALSDAEVLSRGDLRDKYTGMASLGRRVNRALNADEEPVYYSCPACGSRLKRKESE